MALSDKLSGLLPGLFPQRRKRRQEKEGGFLAQLETSRVIAFGIFFLTVASIVVISFVGIHPAGFQILPNQYANVRIIASSQFSYESRLLTERKREEIIEQTPPVYSIVFTPLEQFERHIQALIGDLETLEEENLLREPDALLDTAEAFNARGSYRLSLNDLDTLTRWGNAEDRRTLLETGLFFLREIYREGVFDRRGSLLGTDLGDGSLVFINEDGRITQRRIQSLDNALVFLRINLSAENIPPAVATAMFRLFSQGLTTNLLWDPEATRAARRANLAGLQPEIVTVAEGRSIIEPGTRVTPEQHEMLLAYQEHLAQVSRVVTGLDAQLIGRVLLVLGMVMAAVFYIRLEDRATLSSNTRLGLLVLVVVGNLLAVRLCFELGILPYFLENFALGGIVPYAAPVVLAPLIVAILIGIGPALFTALLVSLFTAVIFGNRLDLLVISFLSATVAVFCCRHIRRRGKVVTAGFWAGLTVAVAAFLLGLADQIPLLTIGKQMVAGQASGLVTAIVVIGLLPILEGLFKRTTDITLLELSDYNHPLLRRMQLEAPGTYHHSLMVGSLSENAANGIGANALLCRVCCMFHDIGKMVKPEYFAENQRGGANPHDEKSPSFSALVIKSHVKEGVDLALTHKLPRPVIDVIRQHHGTSLIYYFYHRARENERLSQGAQAGDASGQDSSSVSESTYRYDGPRPQSRESGIILLADSIEAASRSLQKVTPQSVRELVENITEDRIRDGQLDECPLTLADLNTIRESFIRTLFNSLHSRLAYPSKEKEKKESREPATPAAEDKTRAPAGSRS
ncbi:MAG: HDIG domain-containing protein [Puniceicoccaceae bacterium]|nr:MAG: HDIG domain-containing protein [Puniceicoccaceae bacterium]